MKLDIKSFYRDMKKSHEKGRPGFLLCGAFFLGRMSIHSKITMNFKHAKIC